MITDFTATGPHGDRLLIESEPDTISAHGKNNTLLEWGSDPSSATYTSVLLLGVKHNDISTDDFVFII